jgi:hypothetical protein
LLPARSGQHGAYRARPQRRATALPGRRCSFEKVAALSDWAQIGERKFQILSLSGIIQSKAFLRRLRDLQVLPELEMMREAKSIRENAAGLKAASNDETPQTQPREP